MLSFCTVARDTPNLKDLIDLFKEKWGGEYEICIGDNSTKPEFTELYKELADVYVRIEDKEFFRMGIPWAHNRVVAQANSYKIFYMDSDEYPVWINPDLDEILDVNYVAHVLRYDFLTMKEIEVYAMLSFAQLMADSKLNELIKTGKATKQDRVYNSRYAKFEGVCHSIFHTPVHFKQNSPGVLVLHNKSVRDAKNLDRMRDIIQEQFSRQNINPHLASSDIVIEWGREQKHKYKDVLEFQEAYK